MAEALNIEQATHIVNKLNELEDVKANIETGIVAIFVNGIWNLLNLIQTTEDQLYIVEYSEMRIGTVNSLTGVITYILCHDIVENCRTLFGKQIEFVVNNEFMSVCDTETHSYIPLEPVMYRVGNLYCDQDFNKIARGTIMQCIPFIHAFKHVYVINGKYVLVSYNQDVTVHGDIVKIGDVNNKKKYSLLYETNTEHAYLANSKKKIYLNNIHEFLAGVDSQGLYRGLTFRDQKKYRGWIFEIEGIWLGLLGGQIYEQIYPCWPETGQHTKPAAQISFEDA